jgi:hypothetical protein
MDLVAAAHDGYERLADPIRHRRWVAGSKKDGWLVRDTARGQGRHRFDLRWRLAPQAELVSSAPWRFRWPGGASLSIVLPAGLEWQARMEEAEFSPVYGEVLMASALHLSCERNAPVEAAAVLLPGMADANLRCLLPGLYHWSDGGFDRVFWFGDRPGVREALGWRTDAAFVLLVSDKRGSIESLSIAGATHLEAHGRTVLRSSGLIDFIEWQPGDGPPLVPHWDPQGLTAPRPA